MQLHRTRQACKGILAFFRRDFGGWMDVKWADFGARRNAEGVGLSGDLYLRGTPAGAEERDVMICFQQAEVAIPHYGVRLIGSAIMITLRNLSGPA